MSHDTINHDTIIRDTIRERVIIDLDQAERSSLPVGESLLVQFPERNFGKLKFLSKLALNRTVKDVVLGIRHLKVDPKIKLRSGSKPEDLFQLISGPEKIPLRDLPRQFRLTKEDTQFLLLFQPDGIADCTAVQSRRPGEEPDRYRITGEVYVQNTGGDDLSVQPFEIEVEFKELRPDFRLELTGPRRGQVHYTDVRAQDWTEVGEIRLTNPRAHLRSPKVNFRGHLTILGPDGRQMEALEIADGVRIPRGRIARSNDNSLSVSKLISEPVKVDGQDDFMPSRHKVFINFRGIPNPLTDYETYTLKVDGAWSLESAPEVRNPVSQTRTLRLLKDMQGTELRVSYGESEVANGTRITPGRFAFIPGDAFRHEVRLTLANVAEDSSRGGALKIGMPRIVTSPEAEGSIIFDSRRRSVDPNLPVSLEGDFHDRILDEGEVVIANGKDASHTLSLIFDPARVFALSTKTFDFRLTTAFEFDYWENGDGRPWEQVERKTFKMNIVWDLRLLPFPQWLALDYGSSAIVAMYDKGLIDLAARRKAVFGKEQQDWSLWKVDDNDQEHGTKFMPSSLLFNIVTRMSEPPVSDLCSEQDTAGPVSGLALCLAPTPQLTAIHHQRFLPCLKLLVGNSTLPSNPDYDDYKYMRRDPNGNVTLTSVRDARENEEENALSNINTLFDEAYKIVFKYYLSHEIPEIDRLNRLALTYPNSYTPEHLKVLEEIAFATFPNLRPGYLKFVSESDAVAAYYMDHWKDYNPGGDMRSAENILVYDMGAGTLDITYLSKTYDATKGEYRLQIKGKLGISKAGNYLDFVLARIIDPKLASTERPKGANADRTARARIELKEFVRSKVKPALSGDTSTRFHFHEGDNALTVGDILKHKDFKAYLRECTAGVVDRLEAYMQGDLRVDTVILSGRSCRLKPLKEALEKAMAHVPSNRPGGKAAFRDLALPGDQDRQKTAVVEGAVTMASSYMEPDSKVKIHSRRLYASFGVCYKALGGEMRYVELAGHSEMPETSEKGQRDFDEVTLSGMTHTGEVTLIQSFLSEDETRKAVERKDFEYISEMSRFGLDSFAGQDELRMRVSVDRNNRVSLSVNGHPARGQAPKGIDLANEVTKQSIWPATI